MTHIKTHIGKRTFLILTIFSMLLASTLSSCGGSKEIIGGAPASGPSGSNTPAYTANDFQIGETWDARPLSLETLHDENNFIVSRMASNIAQITTPIAKGTAFYLGRHNGSHLMATNAHVLKNILSCRVSPVIFRFTIFGVTMKCDSIITIRRDIDFALLSVETNDVSQSFLEELNPLKFAFDRDVNRNVPVYTAGYGEFLNPEGKMTLKDDRDCRIYSKTNDFRKLLDPEKIESKKIPSMAVGCDISPGDSGSPIVNRVSGEVMGIIWSTQTPKPITMRSRLFLDNLQNDPEPEIWEHMAYGIPASVIKRELIRFIDETRLSWPTRKRRKTVQALLGLDF